MRGELASPLAEQVSRALDIPLPRLPKRLEMVRYIVEYEEEGHDPVAPGAREARLRPRQGSSPRGAQGPVLVVEGGLWGCEAELRPRPPGGELLLDLWGVP